MSAQGNGGQAFPCSHQNMMTGFPTEEMSGMTLRDYFAAQALTGMLADSNVQGSPKTFAERSYALADAMLEARQQ